MSRIEQISVHEQDILTDQRCLPTLSFWENIFESQDIFLNLEFIVWSQIKHLTN